ncbi:hypothetical protein [Thermogemmata fonticola]|jgi:hypothetical protein|uniref:Uncharacterized protein n=1 Tax=Thermogemmata fonticola TaxID=2755323 RepID=A0A7V9AA94_9BACT|nr:hypothetical protein [Thermogemmata fonticola]MBA2224679.1 hypothetical protein [Thermogemmata fonticola]
MNCEHMLWGVALGVGVRCGHPANKKDGKLFKIPYRNYTCEHFSEKQPPERQDTGEPVEPTGS